MCIWKGMMELPKESTKKKEEARCSKRKDAKPKLNKP